MDDPIKDKLELLAIRNELEELRARFEPLKRQVNFDLDLAQGELDDDLDAEPFDIDKREALLNELEEIERQADILEARVAEIEARYGVGATLN